MRSSWRRAVAFSFIATGLGAGIYVVGCSSNDTSSGPNTAGITQKVLVGDVCNCATQMGDLALVTNAPGVVQCMPNPADPAVCQYMSQPRTGFACGPVVAPGFSPTTKAADGTTLYCCGGVLMATDVCNASSVDASVTDTAVADSSVDSATDSASDTLVDSAADAASDAADSGDASSDSSADAATDSASDAVVIDSAVSDAADSATDAADSAVSDSATGDAADAADVSDASDSSVTDGASDAASDAIVDASGDTLFSPANGVCTPPGSFPAAPTTGFQVIWQLPSGYAQVGKAQVQGHDYTQSTWCPAGSPGFPFCTSGPAPYCNLTTTDSCLYGCTFSTPVPSGARVTFNIGYADAVCTPNGASWVFDLSSNVCGGHGGAVGKIYVGMAGVWNLCSTAAGSVCQIVSPDGSLYEWAQFTAP